MNRIKNMWPVFIMLLIVGAVLVYTSKDNMALDTTEPAEARNYGSNTFIRVAVNEQPTFIPCRIINNQPLVPIRAIIEASGATANWNPATQTIVVTYKEKTIKAALFDKKAEVNNRAVSLDAAPMLVEGQTLLPLSLIEGPLELKSSWNEPRKTMYITTRDYKPATTVEKRQHVQRVPILMYHELGDGPNSLYVRDHEFYEQMRYLKENNYRVLCFSDVVYRMHNKEALDKAVVITFDDAYESFYTKAWPLLKSYRFPATVFVITEKSQTPGYLSWEQSKLLYAGWMEIGSHTKNHPWLAKQSQSVYRDEIFGSKQIIEEQLKVPCEVFCYPGGSVNRAVADAVKEADYLAAVTTQQGQASINNDLYQLPRIRVPRGMSLKAFAANIN